MESNEFFKMLDTSVSLEMNANGVSATLRLLSNYELYKNRKCKEGGKKLTAILQITKVRRGSCREGWTLSDGYGNSHWAGSTLSVNLKRIETRLHQGNCFGCTNPRRLNENFGGSAES